MPAPDLETRHLGSGGVMSGQVGGSGGGSSQQNVDDAITTHAALTNVHGLGGASGLALTRVEQNLGSLARRGGTFDITGLSGLTSGRPVMIVKAAGPYTGKGTREDE